MKGKTIILVSFITLLLASCNSKPVGKHLFILSGQSNMAMLVPQESFIPSIEAEFGAENVIVVKEATGGQPIRRWYKNWKSLDENGPKPQPDLYDSLMSSVFSKIENEKIATVTFIWMQGERDAREKFGEVYEKSLEGLYSQLSKDLNREDVNFIIGRLSDFGLENINYPHWQMIRAAQVELAKSDPRFGWINTDDLNDGYNKNGKEIKNDLHMSVKGYKIMGDRFAGKAIELIEVNSK